MSITGQLMTPAEFSAAIWNAWAQLFVTTDEAMAAIKKYDAEYQRDYGSRDNQQTR